MAYRGFIYTRLIYAFDGKRLWNAAYPTAEIVSEAFDPALQ